MAAGYEVSVSCSFFEAESPEDAVAMMVAWLLDDAARAAYLVSGPDGIETFIDAERLDFDHVRLD